MFEYESRLRSGEPDRRKPNGLAVLRRNSLTAGVLIGSLVAASSMFAQQVNLETETSPVLTRNAPVSAPPGTKPSGSATDAEAAKRDRAIQLTGLLQTWYGNGLGARLGGSVPGQSLPQGRNYDGSGRDEIRFRRAQLALSGEPLARLDYRLMLDFAAPSRIQDAWVGYSLGRGLRIEVGRQKTGLSEEGSRPDDALFTIARSTMNENLPVTAGRVGDVRATGTALRYRFTGVHGFLGIWDSLGDNSDFRFGGARKFADGAVYLDVVPHMTFGLWGGTNVGGSGAVENRTRVGGTLLYHNGRSFFESEVAYTRDYAAGAPAPGKTGSLGRGGYAMLAYRLSPMWQIVGRYDNWDPAQQGKFTGVATTESGIPIPPSNHKLREYTVGLNYNIPHRDARLQFNYIREDVEENGGGFFGVPRNLVFLNLQIGYDPLTGGQTRPEDYVRQETPNRKLFPLQNALRIGFQVAPQYGLALGMDIGVPKFHLLPSAYTRLSGEVLAPFDVPSFLGFPQTSATLTLDQVFGTGRQGRRGLYAGFGFGGNISSHSHTVEKLFVGHNFSSFVGVEAGIEYIGLPAPRFTVQARIPL